MKRTKSHFSVRNFNQIACSRIHIKSAYVGIPKLTGMMHYRQVIGPSNSIFIGSTVPRAISITGVSSL